MHVGDRELLLCSCDIVCNVTDRVKMLRKLQNNCVCDLWQVLQLLLFVCFHISSCECMPDSVEVCYLVVSCCWLKLKYLRMDKHTQTKREREIDIRADICG